MQIREEIRGYFEQMAHLFAAGQATSQISPRRAGGSPAAAAAGIPILDARITAL